MKTRLMLISLILITLISAVSCQGLNRIPIIPDSVKDSMDRHMAVNKDLDNVEYYEVEGFRVTFYPQRMRIIIEKTDTAPEPECSAK